MVKSRIRWRNYPSRVRQIHGLHRAHCLVYSSIIPDKTLAEINKLAKRENQRYGVWDSSEKVEQHDWLDYQPTSETGFIEAMCNADFVISGAGNQLLAETLHLGIPVLITPIPNQFEQTITAKMQVIAKPDQFAMFHADAEIPHQTKTSTKVSLPEEAGLLI